MAVRLKLFWFLILCPVVLCLYGCGGGGGGGGSSSSGSIPGESNVENEVILTEKEGVTTTNYPVQIARPFVMGEIAQFPQVRVDGVPITTQADVKLRWPDGSVKHAILSFLVPLLPAGGSVTLTFQNQAQGNNTGFLTRDQMLSPTFDFDATMELISPSSATLAASARTMLQSNAFSYWVKGSVATTVILADHSAGAAFDMGFDAYKPFRPIFHATFWPAINKVKVRFIGEAANTEAIEDMEYALVLKTKASSPETVYAQGTFTHHAATRWTRTAWMHGKPSAVAIDHNLAYLAETRFVPNYDKSKIVSLGAILSSWSKWQSSPKALYDPGRWTMAMGTAGGRSEIGPYPTWTVQWLYTGDERMEAFAFGQADLAAAWPMHFREARAGKNLLRIDAPGAGTGLGRVLSVTDRPSICLWVGFDYAYTTPEDRITPTGPYTTGGWEPDGAHQPDPFSPQYTLTGDFWYLEELYFWASYSAARYNGKGFYGRGPTGSEGGIHDEPRGDAWVFRNRAQTAFLAPDDSPEKAYFTTLTQDAIAIWEGVRDLSATGFYGTPNWNWGHGNIAEEYGGLGVPPLHHWNRGKTGLLQPPVDPAMSAEAISLWEENFILYSLGRAKELGFPTDALLTWFSYHLINMLTHPDFDPYLVAAYRIPTVRLTDSDYFRTFAELMTGFLSPYDAQAKFESYLDDPEHGYCFIALAAASMIRNESSGLTAWNRIKNHTLAAPVLNDIPKWALLPR